MLYCFSEYNKFRYDYKKIVISAVINNYSEICKNIEEARSFIRNNNQSKTRGDQYKECKKYLETIRDNIKILNSSRDELNKLMRKERNQFIYKIAGVTIAAATLAATIISVNLC